jgi:mono/diheme cytochrome c family protein
MNLSFTRYVFGLALFFAITAQAQQRGEALYKEQCASCHGDGLEGRAGPPLIGADFKGIWEKQGPSELVNKIKKTMPRDNPGKLTDAQTADLVAFLQERGKSSPSGPGQPSSAASGLAPAFPAAGNLAQLMRGIFFPNSNILFTVQSHDPAEKAAPGDGPATGGGFNWTLWGSNLYPGWEVVDYAAIALAEAAPLMLTPGRRCENGKPVPVADPEWIQFTNEMAEAGKAAYRASQTRNQETVSDVTNVIADACMHCHQVYRDKRPRGGNILQTNNAARCTK